MSPTEGDEDGVLSCGVGPHTLEFNELKHPAETVWGLLCWYGMFLSFSFFFTRSGPDAGIRWSQDICKIEPPGNYLQRPFCADCL